MPFREVFNEQKRILDLTTHEMSAKCGLPDATISRILSGQTENPTFESISAIARILHVSLDEIVGITNVNEAASIMVSTAKEELRLAHEALDTAKKELSAAQISANKAEETKELLASEVKNKSRWINILFIYSILITLTLLSFLLHNYLN